MPDSYSRELGNKLGIIFLEAYVARLEKENEELSQLFVDPWYVAGDNETHCKFCFRTWRPNWSWELSRNITEEERPDLYHDFECPCSRLSNWVDEEL
jgi:hypothetical protein